MTTYGSSQSIIKCTLSKLKFPEFCPVCMDEPYDLVPITVIERACDTESSGSTTTVYSRGTSMNESSPGLQSSVLFWIPACASHANIRTMKKRFVGALGFFILFYPALFLILAIIRDVHYGGSLPSDITLFIFIDIVMLSLILYGFFPRSLERAIIFERVNRGEDLVILRILNDDYRRQFLELNEMHAGIISG
ncbi:MAG: hypothetical protein ACTSYL_11445 [Candidatus Thorarchaeota archaeon]